MEFKFLGLGTCFLKISIVILVRGSPRLPGSVLHPTWSQRTIIMHDFYAWWPVCFALLNHRFFEKPLILVVPQPLKSTPPIYQISFLIRDFTRTSIDIVVRKARSR